MHHQRRRPARLQTLAAALLMPAAVSIGTGASGQVTDFTFSAPTVIQLPDDQWPSDLVAGDLNDSGFDDLVVAGRNNDGIVYVLLNNGDGTFAPPQSLIVVGQTDKAALADFNGDGDLDLALAVRSFNGRVGVLFGNGDGTFDEESATYYQVGRLTQSLDIGDLNGDGHIDIVAGNFNSGTVRMLLNNGDGTFTVGQSILIDEFYSGTISINDVHVGDIDGDGNADIAVVGLGSSRITVLLGDGSGTFSIDRSYQLPTVNGQATAPSVVLTGDVSQNEQSDMISSMAIGSEPQRFAVFTSPIDGEFPDPPEHFPVTTTGTTIWTMALADFDGDGRLDIVTGTALSPRITFAKNVSEGGNLAFLEPMQITGGAVGTLFVRSVLPMDVNGNGVVDLVTTDYAEHRLQIRFNQTPQQNAAASEHVEQQGVAPADSRQHPSPPPDRTRELLDMLGMTDDLTVRELLIKLEELGDPL